MQPITCSRTASAYNFFEHSNRIMQEKEDRAREIRQRSEGLAQMITSLAVPCTCSGMRQNSHLYHNYKPLEEPLENLIQKLVAGYQDAGSVIVCAGASILKHCESEKLPLCRDKILRLVAISIAVNAKFWDDGAACQFQNSKVSMKCGIPLVDFNAMEMSFMRSLDWNLMITKEVFNKFAQKMQEKAPTTFARSESSETELNRVDTLSTTGSQGSQEVDFFAEKCGAVREDDKNMERLSSPFCSTLVASDLLVRSMHAQKQQCMTQGTQSA